MVNPFSNVKGNARVIVLSEGTSAITFQWSDIYLPLYMLALGASEIQVGLLASVFILTQFVSSFIGGYIADRFGRKRLLVVVALGLILALKGRQEGFRPASLAENV
jgi:MFS family permease